MSSRRVVVIGAGHNGLVAACYLAKAGYQVTVFEKRKLLGGCCVTDESIFPGCKVSAASYVNSLFLPEIVEDLGLKKYGYQVLRRYPSSFTPSLSPDEPYLFMGDNLMANGRNIAQFSERDADRYLAYEDMLDRIADFVEPTMTMTPPRLPPRSLSDWRKWLQLKWRFLKLGPRGMYQFIKLMTSDAISFLDSWFESEFLKSTILLDAAIGAMDFQGALLLHHVMGRAGGARGVWGYQKGGMGAITNALEKAALDLGVRIYRDTSIKEIEVKNGRVRSVLTGDGVYAADIVVSNADPYVTFVRLLPIGTLPQPFAKRVEKIDFSSAVMKVNLLLRGLPDFRCLPGTEQGPQHVGTIHLMPKNMRQIKYMADRAKEGLASQEPILEITIPTTVDDSLAPPGVHLMNIFVQYAPYAHSWLDWDDYSERCAYFERSILGVLRMYISNIDDIIQGVHIVSPFDLYSDYSLTEGNIFHGAMNPKQLFCFRPLRGYADYRTPIEGLYLCGAGTHPGGGVSGINGYNAAREIINS